MPKRVVGATIASEMSRYYFDLRDDARFVPDTAGMEFRDFDHAALEAVKSLMEYALEVVPGGPDGREIVMVMKDENRRALLTAVLTFELVKTEVPPA